MCPPPLKEPAALASEIVARTFVFPFPPRPKTSSTGGLFVLLLLLCVPAGDPFVARCSRLRKDCPYSSCLRRFRSRRHPNDGARDKWRDTADASSSCFPYRAGGPNSPFCGLRAPNNGRSPRRNDHFGVPLASPTLARMGPIACWSASALRPRGRPLSMLPTHRS